MKTHQWDWKYCLAAIWEVRAEKCCFALTEEVTLIGMPNDIVKRDRRIVMILLVGTDSKSEKQHHLLSLEGKTSLLPRKFAYTS